jgi:glycosyltransferase involved in cell wall biosynthesis
MCIDCVRREVGRDCDPYNRSLLVSQTPLDSRFDDSSPAVADSDAAPRAPALRSNLRRLAIVPAYNEAASIDSVIRRIHAVDPNLEIVVIDDGSIDATSAIAARAGAHVVRLPYNLGIGGAVQTGHQFARDRGFDVAVQVDGDGQHDPDEIPKLLEPILEGRADMVVGSRFAGDARYRAPIGRRLGIRLFARLVSLIVRQRVTDTTSGFRAVNRRGICLFAGDYPHDYPEVEATVLVHRHQLRMIEVPVRMRTRTTGRSSITPFRSAYYMGKVLLALFIGLFRKRPTPLED